MNASMLKKKRALTTLFISTLFLVACKNEQIIDKLAMVQSAGYDFKNKQIHSSVLLGEYTQKDKTNILLLKTTSQNSYDMMTRLNTQINNPIAYGQMRMMVFGQAFARKGIGEVMNILSHDVSVSRHLQLALSSDSAEDIMRATIETHDPLYLMRMVNQNYNSGNLPDVNLHQHIYTYYGQGQDLYMPTFTLTKDGKVDIDGLAIFKEDKVLYHLPIDECLWFKLLMGNAKNGTFLMTTQNKGHIQITIESSKNKMQYQSNTSILTINDKLIIRASIKNISENIQFTSKKHLDQLENELGAFVQEKIETLVRKFQSLKLDPVGFGSFVRSRDSHWNEEEFYQAYEQLKLVLYVEFKLNQLGIEQ